MDYTIVMDAAGDIDPEFAKENDIRFIPMQYSVNDSIRTCFGAEGETALAGFYDSQKSGALTRTSQISPERYEAYFRDILAEGRSVLYLCLSGGLSATYQSACIARQSLAASFPGLVFLPLDTFSASGGMGILAERAARNRSRSMTIEENFADLTAASRKMEHRFMVDDLLYLKRGGRVRASAAVFGTALHIKPILSINARGKLDTVAKKRGSKSALKELLTMFSDRYSGSPEDPVYIIHADNAGAASILRDGVKKAYPDSVIRVCGLSPIIGAHTGPGMAAICFIGK